MGEDLKKANEGFKKLMDEVKKRKKITKEDEALAYYFYLAGFRDGSGMVQLCQ